jgi:major membrane immunogen (membrane-anchored lipoprotein)
MKHIITLFVLSSILTSCNSSNKTKRHYKNLPNGIWNNKYMNDSTKEFKNIDTDEALIKTALMAVS